MTDNEIIKALECCISNYKCRECHYKPKEHTKSTLGCSLEVVKYALDLINSQKEQIKKLENIERLATKTIEKQEAEIERLQEHIKHTNNVVKQVVEDTKTEAIKEFWGKLITKRIAVHSYNNTEDKPITKFVIEISEGDNLVKEMTEQ